jgi:hypothetical protein
MHSSLPMAHNGSMLNLWIVRDGAGDALLAKVQNEVYLLAFTSAVKAMRMSAAFAAAGSPFLIVAANVRDVAERARAADARGFIIDYDVELARFTSAHPLPSAVTSPTAAAR